MEVDVFDENMSILLFNKNFLPVATRYLSQSDPDQYLPTIVLQALDGDVVVDVSWQTQIAAPPAFQVVSSRTNSSLQPRRRV